VTRPAAATSRIIRAALTAVVANGCSTEAARPDPHYVLGPPYRAGSIWFYPREAYDLDETGLAVIAKGSHPPLTTDGEAFDQTALAGAHPTLQLPAIARLTNLENDRQVTVRLNDRGAGDPHRLVQITRRAGTLLGMTGDAVARVRLQVLPGESRAAAEALPGAPSLAISAAPRETVEAAELPPPDSVRQADGPKPPASVAVGSAEAAAGAPPMRLPEVVVQTVVEPNRLMVRLDSFNDLRYAGVQQAKMRAAGARIRSLVNGRVHQFRVEIGPLPDVSRADAVLDQAFAHGIPDARIVID